MGTKISSNRTDSSGGGGGAQSERDDEQQPLGGTQGRTDAEREAEQRCDEQAEETAVDEREGKQVAERREEIRESLEDRFDIEEQHIFGSFTRNTLVGPLDEDSDTDVMYVLDETEHGQWRRQENGARNCLQEVKRAIENDPRYDDADVSIDRNVVAVQFDNFTVEVAPAFRQGHDFVIPDTYQGGRNWVQTNPRRYKQMFQATNEARNGKVAKLARLAKQYNENTGKNVSSYHMEVMVYDFMKTRPKGDEPIDELATDFFGQLPRRLSSGTRDPATGERIDEGMSEDARRDAIDDAKRARQKVREAQELKETGDGEKAGEKYGKVFEGDVND